MRTLCPSLCPSLSNDEYLIIPIPVQPRPVHYPGHRPSSLPLFKVITHQGKVSFKSPQPVSRPRAERSNFNPIERFLVKKNSLRFIGVIGPCNLVNLKFVFFWRLPECQTSNAFPGKEVILNLSSGHHQTKEKDLKNYFFFASLALSPENMKYFL